VLKRPAIGRALKVGNIPDAVSGASEVQLRPLMEKFGELMLEQPLFPRSTSSFEMSKITKV
jgi:hypothetical protein